MTGNEERLLKEYLLVSNLGVGLGFHEDLCALESQEERDDAFQRWYEWVRAEDTVIPGDYLYKAVLAAAQWWDTWRREFRDDVHVADDEIFRLYEDVFGMITNSQTADELVDAANRVPASWIRDAFQEAQANEARHWNYVRAILASWEKDGRSKKRHDGPRRREPGQARHWRGFA